MPVSLRRGRVSAIAERHAGLVRLAVDGRACVAYPRLTGPVALGDDVVVNTQAADLGLGSALVVVFFYLHYPSDYFLLTIGTAAAIVDGTFLYLFLLRKRQLADEAVVRPASMPAARAALAQP